ncbi:MAG: hypothetical protein GXO09_05220 [Crenarchaeota archaeon]|nr:hypothetical protein [Thermoproteota archaeon]
MVSILLPLLLAGMGAILSLGWGAAAAAAYAAASLAIVALGAGGALGAWPLAFTAELRLLPWLPAWRVELAAGWLGSVFLIASGLALLVSSIYMYRDEGLQRLARISIGLGIAGTFLLVLARDVLTLLASWEMLSFAVALAAASTGDKRSGLLYLILMHVVSLPMIASIAFMIGQGVTWFDKLPAATLPLVEAALLAAYTAKAGLPPLGFWIPPVYSSTRGSSGGLLVASELPPLYQAFLLLTYSRPGMILVALYVQAMAGIAVGFAGGLWAKHARRVLGYTTMEYSGFEWLLLTLYASTSLDLVLAGLAALIVAHAAYKAGLLASTWDLVRVAGTDNLASSPGICRDHNTACRLAAFASSSALPVPPLAASIGELMLIYSLAIIARSYPPLPWTYAALLAAVILAPVTGMAYGRVASALLGGDAAAESKPLPDYAITAVLAAAPILAALAAARLTPGLLNWLTLYAIAASCLATARAVKPPRTRVWLSGETIHSTSLVAAAVGLAAPSPRLSVEDVAYRLRMPILREITYAPAYHWAARRLAALSKHIMRLHNGKLHLYLALLLAYMVLLFILALWVVFYA